MTGIWIPIYGLIAKSHHPLCQVATMQLIFSTRPFVEMTGENGINKFHCAYTNEQEYSQILYAGPDPAYSYITGECEP